MESILIHYVIWSINLIFESIESTLIMKRLITMRYLFVLLVFVLVGCGEAALPESSEESKNKDVSSEESNNKEVSSEESTVKEETIIVSESDDSDKWKQSKCEDMDGLEVRGFDKVPPGFNGLAYCCVKGKVEKLAYFKDGKKEGVYRKWHRGYGTLEIEQHYRAGERDGIYRQWSHKGALIKEINYKDGKKEGIRRAWDRDGQLVHEQEYKDDMPDGVERKWINGQLWWESTYKKGNLIKRTYYDEDGQIQSCEGECD